MGVELVKCPNCKKDVDDVCYVDTAEPFTAYNPWEGLNAWGPADVPKQLVCCTGQWAHIKFMDNNDERMVRMLRA